MLGLAPTGRQAHPLDQDRIWVWSTKEREGLMSLQDRVDAVLSGAVSAGDVPGVVAGVTTASDTIYESGFGERAMADFATKLRQVFNA